MNEQVSKWKPLTWNSQGALAPVYVTKFSQVWPFPSLCFNKACVFTWPYHKNWTHFAKIKTFLAYLFISIFSNFFRLSTLVKLQSSFSISQLSLWSLLRIEHLWVEIMPCPNRSHSASLWIPSSSQTTTNYAFGGPWQLVKSEISTLTTGIVDLKQLAKC